MPTRSLGRSGGEISIEEIGCASRRFDQVLASYESVSFVLEVEVLDRAAGRFERVDDLLGLVDRDPRVVPPVQHQ